MEGLEKQKDNKLSIKKAFSEAVLIAILTAVGYLAAFSYQYSYLRYFGVPTYFVDVNLSLVLLMAFSGLVSLIVLFMLIETVVRRNFYKKSRGAGFLILMTLFIYLPVMFSFYNPFHPFVSMLIISVMVIGIAIAGIQIYKNDQIIDKKKGLLDRLESLYGVFPIIFVMILVVFVGYCGVAGKLVAQYQQNYLVANTNPPRVIISTYEGNFLGIDFSTTTKTIGENITLITPEMLSSNGINFTESNLGSLYPSNFATLRGWMKMSILF